MTSTKKIRMKGKIRWMVVELQTEVALYQYLYIYIYIYLNLLKSEFGSIYWNLSWRSSEAFYQWKKNMKKAYLQLSRWQHQEPSRTWGHVSGWRQEGKPALSSQWRIMSLACRSHRGHVVTFRSKTWVAWTRNEATGGSATSSTM